MKKKLLVLSSFSMASSLLLFTYNYGVEIIHDSVEDNSITINYDKNIEKPTVKRANNFYKANNGKYYDISGIGYGIDAIKGHYGDAGDIKTDNNIFADSFLNQQLSIGSLNTAVARSYSTYESANSISSFETKFGANYNYSASVSAGCFLFSASAGATFNLNGDVLYSNYINSYFFHAYQYSTRYNFTLPNTANLDVYRANLDTTYQNYLDKLFSGQISYESFFDLYGTHLVSKATYGGICDIYYTIASNSIDLNINTSVGAELNSKVSGLLSDFRSLSAGNSINFSLNNEYNSSISNTKESFYARTYGGQSFACISMNNLPLLFSDWAKTIDASPSMIQMNSLIPLWNILPSKYNTPNYINLLKSKFVEYAQENRTETSKYNTIIPFLPTSNYDIRNSTYNILYNDKYKNNYDEVDLKKYGYSPKLLKKNNFNGAYITITFDYNVVKDGSMNVYLYTTKNNDDGDKFYSHMFHSSDVYAKGMYITKSFNLTIRIDKLIDDEKIIIRYDGSAKWNNKKVKLRIRYSYC